MAQSPPGGQQKTVRIFCFTQVFHLFGQTSLPERQPHIPVPSTLDFLP